MSIRENSDFYVGWGTLALINANLAQLKGRSGLGWFLGSFLLGPFATLLLAVMSPVRRSQEASSP